MKNSAGFSTYFPLAAAAAAAALLLHGPEARAHARILPTGSLPALQNMRDGNKLVGGSNSFCGPREQALTPTVLQAGQKLRIDWEETINHPGYFRIAFSPGGNQGFDQNILLANFPDTATGALPHRFSAEVTVPSTPCTGCSIQLIQYMTEDPAAPSLYYSCADIEIRSSAPTYSPKPAPTTAAPPAPGPHEACD